MSLPQQQIPPVPLVTAETAHQAFPRGNRYIQMRDLFGTIYTDDVFADCYPSDGQPAIRPWRLALVTVMQFAENLSDRQAADAVRDRIAWKYALSMELGDAGFDYSVLSEFRERLLTYGLAGQMLDVMLQCFDAHGLLKTKDKQRTDSTHVCAALRALNQLELVHETIRHVLNELSVQASAWLQQRITPEWFDWYGRRTSNYLLPKKETERLVWAQRVGQDGSFLLTEIFGNGKYPELMALPAVETMRQVWIQNFYFNEGEITLRPQKLQPPASQRIASPYELEARYSAKRETHWVGYKVHLTEACHADAPNLIVNVETRPATEPDHEATEIVHDHLSQRGYSPAEHFVDAGYMSVEQAIEAQEHHQINLMGPVPDDTSWQARQHGYDSTHFMIDWEHEQATCPEGNQSCSWSLANTRSQRPVVKIKSRRADCATCPTIDLCTSNREKRRTLTVLYPQHHYDTQQILRHRQNTSDFKTAHAVRAGVEGTISQAAHAYHARRSRYRGMAKTHLQNLTTAAAINLARIIDWMNEVPRAATPNSRFARLAT